MIKKNHKFTEQNTNIEKARRIFFSPPTFYEPKTGRRSGCQHIRKTHGMNSNDFTTSIRELLIIR